MLFMHETLWFVLLIISPLGMVVVFLKVREMWLRRSGLESLQPVRNDARVESRTQDPPSCHSVTRA